MERSVSSACSSRDNPPEVTLENDVTGLTSVTGSQRPIHSDQLMNAVETCRSLHPTSGGVRTRSAARAVATSPQDLAAWTSRMLIYPRQGQAVELQATPVATTTPTTPPTNFSPRPTPWAPDAVAISDFVLLRQSAVRFVRDAITSAVDRQKENDDRRRRKNTEVMPLATVFCYLRKVSNPVLDAAASTTESPAAAASPVVRAAPRSPLTAPESHAPASPFDAPDPQDVAVCPPALQDAVPPASALADQPSFQRDGPAPLADSSGNLRHIVEEILDHDDLRARPTRPALDFIEWGHGGTCCDGSIPDHRQHLVRRLGPMADSWEPCSTLLQDVPDAVTVYEQARVGDMASRV
ncbi:hypothetical protein PC128_g1617 [Phytophthora cactorum]|nr:hypothetical protein PC128_g1617 [Phytophthora cactorum]